MEVAEIINSKVLTNLEQRSQLIDNVIIKSTPAWWRKLAGKRATRWIAQLFIRVDVISISKTTDAIYKNGHQIAEITFKSN